MNASSRLILFLITVTKSTLGANILCVSPVPSRSHNIWNKAIAMGLVEKGHNVTMLAHEEEPLLPMENFTLIPIKGIYSIVSKTFDIEEFVNRNVLGTIAPMYEFAFFTCQYDYDSAGFRTLLDYPGDHKFDLIIIDNTLSSCYYPLIERFHNPPTIAVTPLLLPPALAVIFGKHLYTSIVPYYSTNYTSSMSLYERALNSVYTYADVLYRKYIHLPREHALIKQKFKKHKLSPDELERNITLLLCNINPILGSTSALPPNIIPVGGLHVKPAISLPEDLHKIMSGAKHGVILFSFGTAISSDQLNSATKQAYLEAFAKLSQTIFWKYEGDQIEELPKNVIIRKWLPQNDILGHPNTKLFIYQGGVLSTLEATYHGVPVIGTPFLVDQHINVRTLVDKGAAKYLDKNELTSINIYQAIQEVLNTSTYRDNMRALSKIIYRDRPETPLEIGIFWILYILRHGSAEHLVLSARDMPDYHTISLDIFVVSVFIVVSTYLVLLFISKIKNWGFTGARR